MVTMMIPNIKKIQFEKDNRIWLKYSFGDDKFLSLLIDGFGYEGWVPSDSDNELLALLKVEFQKIAEKVVEMQK